MSIPNYLTLFRIILTPVFFTLLVSYTPEKEYFRVIALGIFTVAALTDAFDGILARFLKQRTALGQMLDPLADKVLLLSGYVGLLFVPTIPFRPPLWITVTIIFRDIILLIGFFAITFMSVKMNALPNWWGKLTTAAQMLLLILILIEWPLAVPFAYVVAGLTIISGLIYVSKGLKFIQ